jgi:four helix bundle protein
MKDFRKLEVWEKAHHLTLEVYKTTKAFPKDEQYGLISQIRRCSVSIPSNIAEGCGREGETEFGRFLQIAMGSASELEYQLLLSRDLGLVADANYDQLNLQVTEIKRMLTSLIKKLNRGGD